MVATVSPIDSQYHHTVNTLKYSDRAKQIKTHIQKNIGTVDTHVSDYQQMIDSLQIEVGRLKKELAEKESQLSVKPVEKAADDEILWLNILSHETSENFQERINLQKASFELEETNRHNHTELQKLDNAIAKQKALEKDGELVDALRARQQVILDNIRDNDEAGDNYQMEIEANEKRRYQLQHMIEEAISNNGNKTYLRILGQHRLLGMANAELQFEMAMRDQVINNQRETLKSMWDVLMGLGLDESHVLDLAGKQGITIENAATTPRLGLPSREQSPTVSGHSPDMGQSYSRSSCIFQQTQDYGSWSSPHGHPDMAQSFCREKRSFYLMSHDHSPSAFTKTRTSSENWFAAFTKTRTSSENWFASRPSLLFGDHDKNSQDR